MARKPLSEKSVAENCLKWGTGGINIDESRVDTITDKDKNNFHQNRKVVKEYRADDTLYELGIKTVSTAENQLGRFPANLIHDNSEEVRECFPDTKSVKSTTTNNRYLSGNDNTKQSGDGKLMYGKISPENTHNDSGNASRFFKSIIYQAKASKSERNKGCEKLEKGCSHPTVKPIALMEYLIKMVTPKGGTVLDPFAGSGSTLVAAKQNGYKYIGIEMTEEYISIIEARLNAVDERDK